jgi:hypothetical protein
MFDPEEEAALQDVADGLPQKYLASLNCWPISDDPTGFPSFRIMLPFAGPAKNSWAIPVTNKG